MIYYMSFGKLPSFQKSSTFLEKKYNRQPESKVVLIQLAGCRLASIFPSFITTNVKLILKQKDIKYIKFTRKYTNST